MKKDSYSLTIYCRDQITQSNQKLIPGKETETKTKIQLQGVQEFRPAIWARW